MTQIEPTQEQFLAALAAWDAVAEELDFSWVAHDPVQGEATPKVFAYRLVKAALNAADLPRCPACLRPIPGEICKRQGCSSRPPVFGTTVDFTVKHASHQRQCCKEHDTHSTPHVGCILR